MHHVSRRRFLGTAGAVALAFGRPGLLHAAGDPPIADSHSHLGMFSSKLAGHSLKSGMQAAGVMLLSWNMVGDGRWIARTAQGIQQSGSPASGEQAAYFRQSLDRMREYLARNGLKYVATPGDIDAARSGTPHVVIAVEGAGFVSDGIELLAEAWDKGLRHLQLVHYIRNALGDFQTERPEHEGMTALGVEVVQACNRLGVLVDLAHATDPVIEKALEVSTIPLIWSHSALTHSVVSWTQSSNRSRLLYIDMARKIAQRGGAVGLWSLRSTVGSSPDGYATELMRMVDAIGPEHVMFGTDLDGVGRFGTMEGLGDLRRVADVLRARGVDEKTLRAVCFENYARCLGAAMQARKA